MTHVPHEDARTGNKAREEISKLLQRFGCESVGIMDNFAEASVVLAFRYRNRDVQLVASAEGWAAMYLKANPWNTRRKYNRDGWKARALANGPAARPEFSLVGVRCLVMLLGDKLHRAPDAILRTDEGQSERGRAKETGGTR